MAGKVYEKARMKKSRSEVIAAALFFSVADWDSFGKPVRFLSDTD
ncbi:hypothetical protein [Herbaspirillum lusitanum]|nr:hypothetical protein [Herbaspirillum lusitanum]